MQSSGRIILGVSPGIRHLSYCVLEELGDGSFDCLDADTWSGAIPFRRIQALGALVTLGELIRRFRCHELVMDVVWDRYYPSLLVLAPPIGKEPELHAEAAIHVLRAFAGRYNVPVQDVSALALEEHFGRRLASTVNDRLRRPLRTTRRHIYQAAAAAMLARQWRPEPAA